MQYSPCVRRQLYLSFIQAAAAIQPNVSARTLASQWVKKWELLATPRAQDGEREPVKPDFHPAIDFTQPVSALVKSIIELSSTMDSGPGSKAVNALCWVVAEYGVSWKNNAPKAAAPEKPAPHFVCAA